MRAQCGDGSADTRPRNVLRVRVVPGWSIWETAFSNFISFLAPGTGGRLFRAGLPAFSISQNLFVSSFTAVGGACLGIRGGALETAVSIS